MKNPVSFRGLRFSWHLAVMIVSGLMLGHVASPALALPPSVGVPLKEAARAATQKKKKTAQTALDRARNAAETPEEKRKVSEMAAYVYNRLGDYPRAIQELKAIGAPPAQLAPLYYRAGQFDQAIALTQNSTDPKLLVIAAQSALRLGRFAAAEALYHKLVALRPGDIDYLSNLALVQFKQGKKGAYLKTTETLIRRDASPGRWKVLLTDLSHERMSRTAKFALLGLMQATGNLSRPNDVTEYAKLAIVSGQSGVAAQVLAKAQSQKIINPKDAMVARLIAAANQRAAVEKARVAKSGFPTTPQGQYQWAGALMGLGQNAAAAAKYDAAISGGYEVENATLFKGISLALAGRAKSAGQALAVVEKDAGFSAVARLWHLYATTRH